MPRVERARLYVHDGNARAQALYEKAGFRRSGATVDTSAGLEHEYVIERGAVP